MEIPKRLEEDFATYEEGFYGYEISKLTVINVTVNMISYSIVRDEYREFVKRNKETEAKRTK